VTPPPGPDEAAAPAPLPRPTYRDQHVLVVGLGILGGGIGVTRFLAERGARVTVTDLQSPERLAGSLDALRDYDIHYVLGEHREADFLAADFIVRNPAVPPTLPPLRLAASRGIPIYMEMTLFFLECPSRRITAVTGTKGKTTTTTLIAECLKAAGRPVVIAGNLLISALQQLDQIDAATEVVLELSSFQLEGLEAIRRSPSVAVITNLMPDHLNRYPTLADYYVAKEHIFRYQGPDDVLILNRDNPPSVALAETAPGRVIWFGAEDDVPGSGAPRLRGRHNLANMAAATAAARTLGTPDEVIAQAMASFGGVPYRQELVHERDGVQFINDSAATTPDAVIAALGAVDRPVVLIAGGADKVLDFTALGQTIAAPGSPVKAVVLLEGTATDKLAAAAGAKVVGRFADFAAAVRHAAGLARTGEAVLLSPGCASFGMFVNEFDRGNQFNNLVRAL
jgi:UDP-N-acetylmuramoylalanine--D-glutamate ligase